MRDVNVEAGDYIEDDPEAWTAWVETVRKFARDYSGLAAHLGSDDGAASVTAGAMLSYLADTHSLYLRRERRDDEPRRTA